MPTRSGLTMRPGKGQIDRGRFARRETMATVTFEDFQRIEMRVGRIVAAEDFPEARNPSYKLRVDFGSHGVRRSSAAVQPWYHRDDLIGRPVVAVQTDRRVILLRPDSEGELGARIA